MRIVRTTTRRVAAVGLAVAALAVGAPACRGSIASACDLLTTDEAAEVLGVPVHEGVEDTDRTIEQTYCEWIAVGSDVTEGGEPAYLVYVTEGTDADTRADWNNDLRRNDTEPIAGVGDEAYFVTDSGLPDIHLRVGDRVMIIGVGGEDRHPVGDRKARRILHMVAGFVSSDGDDGAQHLAALHLVERVFDAVEGDGLRYEAVEVEAAL